MFGAISGVRLEKREERGLVRTGTLRRWGNPLNAPELPGERHKIPVTTAEPGSGRATFCARHIDNDPSLAPPLFA